MAPSASMARLRRARGQARLQRVARVTVATTLAVSWGLGLAVTSFATPFRSIAGHRTSGLVARSAAASARDPEEQKKDEASAAAVQGTSQPLAAEGIGQAAGEQRGVSPSQKEEDVDPWTWVFGKPGELRRDLGLLNTTPEAILTAGLLAIVIGLTANLWGETEFFLAVFPQAGQLARQAHLDSVYAVEGLRGYYEKEYSLRYPSTWLFDQRIALAKFGQTEPGSPMLSMKGQRNLPAQGVLPDAAWGPAGGGQKPAKERENLSVVKQLLPPKPDGSPVSLDETLGPADASLQKLLTEKIAPAGSKRTAEALQARSVSRSDASGEGTTAPANLYYEYEWRTRFDAGFALRSYSSVALGPPDARNQRFLYTLTAVLPEVDAEARRGAAAQMPEILGSFRVAS